MLIGTFGLLVITAIVVCMLGLAYRWGRIDEKRKRRRYRF